MMPSVSFSQNITRWVLLFADWIY